MAMVNTKIPDAAALVKRTLGKITWEEIIKEGLKAVKKRKLEEQARKERERSPHVETEPARSPEATQGAVDQALRTPEDKRQHLNSGAMELQLHLSTREYNVFNRKGLMWEKIKFDHIPENEIFRVLQDGEVLRIGGHKYVSFLDYPYRNTEGELCVQVIGRQMKF